MHSYKTKTKIARQKIILTKKENKMKIKDNKKTFVINIIKGKTETSSFSMQC